MARATAAEKARRLNYARQVLARAPQMPRAVEQMVRACDVSPRQAYRYLHHARRLKAPVPVGAAKIPFTVKLPRDLVRRVRAYASASGLLLSDLVSRALAALLVHRRRRG
jgi:predicted DNA-binding transcriptional regulator YafY